MGRDGPRRIQDPLCGRAYAPDAEAYERSFPLRRHADSYLHGRRRDQMTLDAPVRWAIGEWIIAPARRSRRYVRAGGAAMACRRARSEAGSTISSAHIHPEDRERVLSTLKRCLDERCDYRIEYRIIKPDGELSWLEARGKLTVDAEGRPQTHDRRVHGRHPAQAGRGGAARRNPHPRAIEQDGGHAVVEPGAASAHPGGDRCRDGAERGEVRRVLLQHDTTAAGDAFMLYTLSGAPREAFEKFGQPRATPLFGPTFNGADPIRCDDVLRRPALRKDEPASRHALRATCPFAAIWACPWYRVRAR